MEMRAARLRANDGTDIPVMLHERGTTTLLECREAAKLLEHLLAPASVGTLSPGAYIRGVIVHGEGAVFQLRDRFGVVADEIARLGVADARRLVLDRICQTEAA